MSLSPSVGRRVLLLGLVGSVLACSSREPSDLVPLQVGYTRHLTMSPLFIAQAEGFFEDEGLDVELVAMESAAVALPALLQNRLDVLPGPVSTAFFNAIARGARVRVVADKGSYDGTGCSHNAFVVSSALEPSAGNPELRRVSTAKEHFNQFFVERALEARGYDPDAIELYHVPAAAEYDAVVDGRLDGAFMGEPWLTRARQTGSAEIWIPTNDLFDGYQFSVFLFGPRLLDEEPELGERFTAAILRAFAVYDQGKTDRNLDILADMLGHDRAELADICWPTMGTDGMVDLPSLMEFQRWAVGRGDQDRVVEPSEFWEPRFVEAVRNGGAGER